MIIQRLRQKAPEIIELGDDVILEKARYGIIAKLLRNIKSIRKEQDKLLIYNVKLKEESIGFIQIYEEVPEEVLNITWLYIKPKYEGNHYATRVMRTIINKAKELGYRKLTLEVPIGSPNARHIYEKLGFTAVKEIKDETWDNLTMMEKKLD